MAYNIKYTLKTLTAVFLNIMFQNMSSIRSV